MVRRIQKEDLLNVNVSKLWSSPGISNSQKSVNQIGQGHQDSTLAMRMKSIGVHENINIRGPQVVGNQFSSASIFAASDDGTVQNYISAGWSVYILGG